MVVNGVELDVVAGAGGDVQVVQLQHLQMKARGPWASWPWPAYWRRHLAMHRGELVATPRRQGTWP